jgi:hypothetical protein
MKYACLVYLDDESFSAVPDDECMAFGQEIGESGHRLGGEALHPIETATTVRVRNGAVSVTDGPFAETKEQIGGLLLIEAEHMAQALEIAAGWPAARIGRVEVRQVEDELPLDARF